MGDSLTNRVAAWGIEHFHHLEFTQRQRLFLKPPEPLTPDASREELASGLGATLYIPADRGDLLTTIVRRAQDGICSMVLDLEDAVDDEAAPAAMHRVVKTLDELALTGQIRTAMLFVRVRSVEGIDEITARLGAGVALLAGFVFPKFTADAGETYLARTAQAAAELGTRLYAMPVLESELLLYRETRDAELDSLAKLLAAHRETVLAVRVGATDLCGVLGIRRDRDHTIYDVRVVADAIGDIVNRLGRADGTGFVVTAPVWEYFADHERLFRPLLRTTPFIEHDAVRFRNMLVRRDLDGLLREISLDRTNGMIGKTVIHPTHVAAVHALSVVTHEEYRDASDIAVATAGGVKPSVYRNKMNEARPHRVWAETVMRRARVFGVANVGVTFVDLLTASDDR